MNLGPKLHLEHWFEARHFTDCRNDVTADVRSVCGVNTTTAIAELLPSCWWIGWIRNKNGRLAVTLRPVVGLRPNAFVGTSLMLFVMFLRRRLVEQTLETVDVVANDIAWVCRSIGESVGFEMGVSTSYGYGISIVGSLSDRWDFLDAGLKFPPLWTGPSTQDDSGQWSSNATIFSCWSQNDQLVNSMAVHVSSVWVDYSL